MTLQCKPSRSCIRISSTLLPASEMDCANETNTPTLFSTTTSTGTKNCPCTLSAHSNGKDCACCINFAACKQSSTCTAIPLPVCNIPTIESPGIGWQHDENSSDIPSVPSIINGASIIEGSTPKARDFARCLSNKICTRSATNIAARLPNPISINNASMVLKCIVFNNNNQCASGIFLKDNPISCNAFCNNFFPNE